MKMNHYRKVILLWIVIVGVVTLSCRKATGPIDQSPEVEWERTFGGEDPDVGYSIEETSDGGFIVVGYTMSFGSGFKDVYLLKLNAQGDTLWSKTYGGVDDDVGYSVKETSNGNIIIVGHTGSLAINDLDVYIIKTDENGNLLWSRTYGGTNIDEARSVQQTSDGGFIITGFTYSFGDGDPDVYLLRTDLSGDTLWTKTYDFSTQSGGFCIKETNGGFIIAGGVSMRALLMKVDSVGDTIWMRKYGSDSDNGLYSIAEIDGERYFAVGEISTSNGIDIFLHQFNENGDSLFTNTYGGQGVDIGYSIYHTMNGEYIICGSSDSFDSGSFDLYMVKVDAGGNLVWSQTYGGSGREEGRSVVQTQDGGYIVVGCTESYGEGSDDVYLIKLKPEE
jgi:hypothetical protein